MREGARSSMRSHRSDPPWHGRGHSPASQTPQQLDEHLEAGGGVEGARVLH